MSWDLIVGQERVVETLRGAIERDRVAHAYLFHGADGTGKRAAALAFARALECERGGGDACGECRACSKVRRLIHPDVHVLMPCPADTPAADLTERLRRLAENPYAVIDYVRRPSLKDPSKASRQVIYSVDRLKEELRTAVGLRPVEGRYKVVILTDADQMRPEAANAFLKMLEEPPERTVFVLLSSRMDKLLPTIVSRCQRVRFDLLPVEAIEAVLVRDRGLAPGTAATLARMADGALTQALELAGNDDLMADRALVVDLLRATYTRNFEKSIGLIDRLAGMGRDRIRVVLTLLLSWVRDLVLYRAAGSEAALVNIDQAESIAKFCNNLRKADLEAMIGLVEDAMRLAERNVHVGLLLTVLVEQLRQAMNGAHGDRVFVPLVEQPDASVAAVW